MSVIHCNYCDKLVDADFEGCEEDPNDRQELICGVCFDNINPDKGASSVDRYGVGALGDGE